jgi:hypothetical protein
MRPWIDSPWKIEKEKVVRDLFVEINIHRLPELDETLQGHLVYQGDSEGLFYNISFLIGKE